MMTARSISRGANARADGKWRRYVVRAGSKVGTAVTLIGALSLLSACTASPEPAASNERAGEGRPAEGASEAPPAEYATYPVRPGMAHSMVGLLGEITFADGCVRLSSGTVPVFPDGQVAWVDGALVFDGTAYEDGDAVTFGGGSSLDRNGMEAGLPSGCEAEEGFFVVAPIY